MITVDGQPQYSTNEQLEQLRDLLESSKVMGFSTLACVIQHYTNGEPDNPILCIFMDCMTSRVRDDNGMPALPRFYDHFVCEALLTRGLIETTGESHQQDINRIWVKFSDTWI